MRSSMLKDIPQTVVTPARFGYRRLHWLIHREEFVINHKNLRRPRREERLQPPWADVKLALNLRAVVTIAMRPPAPLSPRY